MRLAGLQHRLCRLRDWIGGRDGSNCVVAVRCGGSVSSTGAWTKDGEMDIQVQTRGISMVSVGRKDRRVSSMTIEHDNSMHRAWFRQR